MELTITINLDNAALDDHVGEEIARILHEQNFRAIDNKVFFKQGFNKSILRDINGNKVGKVIVKGVKP